MNKKWKLLKSKPVLKSKWLSVFNNTYKLPDGSVAKDYLHVSRPDYVLIVAIDKNRKIIVEKNYRRGVDDFVYELPAGWLEAGETPQKAAARELKEETGYEGEVEILGETYPEPGFMSMRAHVALAKINTDLKGDQNLGHDEHIDYELVDLSEIDKMIEKNKIKDMGFLAAIKLVEKKIL